MSIVVVVLSVHSCGGCSGVLGVYNHGRTLTFGVVGNVFTGFLITFLRFCLHGSLKGKER